NRRANPAGTKMYARAHLAEIKVSIPRIDGLVEKSDAGFTPQSLAKQYWRINRSGQYGSSNDLSDIIQPGELFRSDLKMGLETGIAALHHDGVMTNIQFVYPLYLQGCW